MDNATLPEEEVRETGSEPLMIPGLVVVWCGQEPTRVGAWSPVLEGKWLFGRGPARETDAYPRLSLSMQRPGTNVGLPPLDLNALSREQLLLQRGGDATIEIERVGRCQVRVNGRSVERSKMSVGDVVELGGQISFICVRRPQRLAEGLDVHPFGEPDAHGIVGESAAMWKVRSTLRFVGTRAGHVLVRGETGTGKELIATAIHKLSGRTGPLVARNAATLPEALVDAELFGNAKDYPNPGMRERRGLVGTADRGTLFLDEFGELPVAEQAHLLRVMDAGEYQRLGDPTPLRSDLRLVAATNRPDAALRPDILARFELRLDLPTLRQRPEDIPLLMRFLLRRIFGDEPALRARFCDQIGEPRIAQQVVRHLVQNPPDGGIRALRNLLWRALAACEGDTLSDIGTQAAEVATTSDAADDGAADDVGAERIREALAENDGSLEKTWKALGLPSRFALMRLMKKLRIEVRRTVAKD